MDSLSIDIYDDTIIDLIVSRTTESKETPLQYISRLIIGDVAKRADVVPQTVSAITESLFQAFAIEYKKRFEIEAKRENGEATTAVSNVVKEMLATGISSADTFKKLAKAIQFYIHSHNNTDSDGNNFPYGLKYLFSSKNNHWLLRLCIESSDKMDDEVLKLMKSKNLSKDQAVRTLRRGDNVGSKKQYSKINKLDEARKLWASLEEKYPYPIIPKGFRFNPNIDGLFKSELPSDEYITAAIAFLERVQAAAETKLNASIQ